MPGYNPCCINKASIPPSLIAWRVALMSLQDAPSKVKTAKKSDKIEKFCISSHNTGVYKNNCPPWMVAGSYLDDDVCFSLNLRITNYYKI